jgi:hypothetical protein
MMESIYYIYDLFREFVNIPRRRIKWLVNEELERMWKEAALGWFNTIQTFAWSDGRESWNALVKIVGVQTHVRTQHVLIVNLERYRCVNPLSLVVISFSGNFFSSLNDAISNSSDRW